MSHLIFDDDDDDEVDFQCKKAFQEGQENHVQDVDRDTENSNEPFESENFIQ